MQIVIIAGGGGTRLWPLSTKAQPKQFIPLLNDLTLLQYTYQLLTSRFPKDSVWISTNAIHQNFITEQLSQLDPNLILLQHGKRETFAAETSACAYIASKCGEEEVVSFVPCDDYWPNRRSEENFLDAMQQLETASQANHLALLGIKPTYPSTEYGYIELEHATWRSIGQTNQVVSFREKPDSATAEGYMDTGNYLWHKHSPTFSYATLKKILANGDDNSLEILAQIFDRKEITEELYIALPKQSIDEAVLEKSDKIVVIGVDAEWEDVGSWSSLEKYLPPANPDTVLTLDGQNNTYVGKKKKVAFVGVSNILVAEGKDGLLIVDTRDSKNIKQVAEKFDL